MERAWSKTATFRPVSIAALTTTRPSSTASPDYQYSRALRWTESAEINLGKAH